MEFVYEDSDEALAKQRIGEVLAGRWRLESLLGVGGMAAVYAGVDSDGRRAAVKVLHPHMNRRRDVRQRFLREGSAASRIAHPGIVQVLEECSAGDSATALVMELLEGQSLTDLLESREVSTLELLDILDQVLDALAAAHDASIVHRDLKPDNLFVTEDGRVKILDFGIARVLESLPTEHVTKTGMTLGTVPFMSPEQALGKRDLIDGRTDLFAVGAMAFRIVTGRYIHQEDTDAALLVAMASKPAPPLRSIAPGSPAELAAVIDLSMAFTRDTRYPDARTMQGDVRALRAGRPPPYAMRALGAREQATRVQIAVPSALPGGAAPNSVRMMPRIPEPPSGPPSSSATRIAPSPSAPTAEAPVPPSSSATRVAPSLSAPTVPDVAPPSSLATRVAPSPSAKTAVASVPMPDATRMPPDPGEPDAPRSVRLNMPAVSLVPSSAPLTSPTPPPVVRPEPAPTKQSPAAPAPSRSTMYIVALLGIAAIGGLAYVLGSGSPAPEALPAAVEAQAAGKDPVEPVATPEPAPAGKAAPAPRKRVVSPEPSEEARAVETRNAEATAMPESVRAAVAKIRDAEKEKRPQKKGGRKER